MEEVNEKEIELLISKAFEKQSMVRFDTNISHLFQSVFYSFSHDAVVMEQKRWYPGIVTHFLKNWKDSIGFSSISKTLPAIITGSIVEGACLSRIFHPSKDASLELEADVMYVVGSITQTVAEKCFEDMTSPGFLRIRNSPDIQIFTKESLVSHQDVIFTSTTSTGEQYIDGSKFKIMHKNMQPQNPRLWLSKSFPYIVDILQQISGPSSEIVFTSMEIGDPEKLQMVVDCLERIEKRWNEECHNLLDAVHEGQRMHISCTKDLASAIVREERYDVDESANTADGDDCKNVLSKGELIELLLKYQSNCMGAYGKYISVLDSAASINFLIDGQTDSKYEGKFNSLFTKGLIREMFDSTSFEGMDHLSMLGQLKKMSEHFESLLVEMDFFKDPSFVLWIEEKRDQLQRKIQMAVQQILDLIDKCTDLDENTDVDKESSGRESTISFDNVSCFHCAFWPKIASEWETRERQWPSPGQIQMILDAGCFVVAKPFIQESRESFLDWRWSFSSAEISLANFRTASMKFCYFIFKSIFYRFLKEETENGKCLPSYVAKTCMLYASEELGAQWFEDNSIAHCIIFLLRNLRQSLTSSFVPHYFIPKLNLLTSMPQNVVDRAISRLTDILKSPSKYFTFHAGNLERIKGIKKEVEQLYSLTASSLSVVNPLEHFDSVTQSSKDHLLNRIEMYKCSRLVELYSIWSRMDNLNIVQPVIKDAIETQQIHFAIPGNEHMAKDRRFQENLKNFQRSEEELSRLEKEEPVQRHKITKQFAKINNLLGTNCRKCHQCSVEINCKSSPCYRCTSFHIDLYSKCHYIECELCYLNVGIIKGNVLEEEKQHQHTMIKSEECLKQCSARIDDENVGKDMLMEIFTLTSKMEFLKQKSEKEGAKIGFSEKNFVSFFGGQGKIVAEESQTLFSTIHNNKDTDVVRETNNHNSCEDIEFNLSTVTLSTNKKPETNEENITKYKQLFSREDEFNKIFEEMKTLMGDIEKRKVIRLCLTPTSDSYNAKGIPTSKDKGITSITDKRILCDINANTSGDMTKKKLEKFDRKGVNKLIAKFEFGI